jgi:hypothetical protein
MDDGSIAPQQDVRQHEGKALLPSAFARLNGKSVVHQQIITVSEVGHCQIANPGHHGSLTVDRETKRETA